MAGRTGNEASGRNCPQPGQKHDVAKKLQDAGLTAILIVDLTIHVIRVRELDQPRRMLKGAIRPRFNPKPGGGSLSAKLCFGERQKHELARVQTEMLRSKAGSSSVPNGISCASIRWSRGVARSAPSISVSRRCVIGPCGYCAETNSPPIRPL